MSIINPSPPKAASAAKRLAFCCDQLNVLIDLCSTLQRSILSHEDKYYHSDSWLVSIFRQELTNIEKEITIVRKEGVV